MNTTFKTKTFTATKTFKTFDAALNWGRIHGRESCMPFHFWSVEQLTRDSYAIAVRSKNDDRLCGYAD
jgi:hypothetical protein